MVGTKSIKKLVAIDHSHKSVAGNETDWSPRTNGTFIDTEVGLQTETRKEVSSSNPIGPIQKTHLPTFWIIIN